MTWLRIFFIGGFTSYRALFAWLTPWILIPSLIIAPVFQVLLFALAGRTAGVNDDAFFLIGNALQQTAIPCLFAMANIVGGERFSQTLPLLLVSPARRLPLFLGRAAPVIVNGFCVSAVVFVLGALALDVRVPASAVVPLLAVTVVSSFSCTGLGLVTAAVSLRVRETAFLANIGLGVLMIFCGVNVPLGALPGWMAAVAHWLPLTHGIDAARALAGGGNWAAVVPDVRAEVGIGLLYIAVGLALLHYLERVSRQRATLETA